MKWLFYVIVIVYMFYRTVYGLKSVENALTVEPVTYGDDEFLKMGGHKTITCKASNRNQKVEWLDPNGHVVKRIPGSRIFIREHFVQYMRGRAPALDLTITRATVQDSGVYQCRSGNLLQNVSLCVIEPSDFADTPVEVVADLGRSITLSCQAKGDPEPRISWNRNGVTISDEHSSTKYRVMTKYNMQGVEGLLTITSLEPEDTGIYSCLSIQESPQAENCSHTSTVNITLNVNYPPIFEDGNKTKLVFGKKNQEVEIVCSTNGYPASEYSILSDLRDDIVFDIDNKHIKLIDDGSKAVVTVVANQSTFWTRFKCQASNEHGDTDKYFTLMRFQQLEKPYMGNCHPPDLVFLNITWNDDIQFPINAFKVQFIKDQSDGIKKVVLPTLVTWRKSKQTEIQFDEVETIDPEINVRSDEEFPELCIIARSVYNIADTKAVLFCKGQNLVEPVQWYSPSGKFVEERSTKSSRVFVEHAFEDNSVLVLIIDLVRISDAGNWTCKAGNLSKTREFVIREKVRIVDRNVTLEGEEGKSVKLTCEANGYPSPVVVWYKDKQQIRDKDKPKKYSIKQDNTLEIKKFNHADVGLYVCKVRQNALSHYTEKTVHLSVKHKPILYNSDTQMIYTNQKYKTEEVYAILNDTKNVTCSAIANPPPTYRWFRRMNGFDDDPITDTDTVITAEDGTNSVLILSIRDESNYGEYRCSANNSKGTESIIFNVNPTSKPEPPNFVRLAAVNTTELTFNVNCTSCIFATGDEVSLDPKNLLVIGYIFQLAPAKQGYAADWDGASEFRVDIKEVNNTLFTVGPLTNGTLYHVRVRTRNAAGNSEWMETPDAKTADDAIRLTATLVLVITAIFVHLYN